MTALTQALQQVAIGHSMSFDAFAASLAQHHCFQSSTMLGCWDPQRPCMPVVCPPKDREGELCTRQSTW
jgi:hypothetical protein